MKKQNSSKNSFVIALFGIILAVSILATFALLLQESVPEPPSRTTPAIPSLSTNFEVETFESCSALEDAFENSQSKRYVALESFGAVAMPAASMAESSVASDSAVDYSSTNIQVEGVDEADIIKTDGKYIYLVANDKFIIARAYPSEKATILSKTKLDDFRPSELFIDGNAVLLFGNTYHDFGPYEERPARSTIASDEMIVPGIYHPGFSTTDLKLLDVSDKESPKVTKEVSFEGNYVTSRKIKDKVYFVANNYPRPDFPVPLYRSTEEFEPIVGCTDVIRIAPEPTNLLTLASFSMSGYLEDKHVIAATAQTVFASKENMFIAEQNFDHYWWDGDVEKKEESTEIHKFALNSGDIDYKGSGEVPGHLLNQFSMDEFNGYFRVATTKGQVWNEKKPSTNNVYVLNKNMNIVGKVEDLAPGERIYSVRFMGEKAYVVTFKKVDPLFVLDLASPTNPKVLGKLKIPGYSDYLHPYGENHIIGLGKDTVEAEDGDFAWYQGIKMAIFDVSDVENPIELHKIIIGDRGTESPALHNHKAFLFDKEKHLLVLPVTLAEVKDKSRANGFGEFVFQGALVYNVNLEDGFVERGRVSHYEDDEAYLKSGYRFYGDSSIERSLFIEDVLYTFSRSHLQLNNLDSLEKLRKFNLN